MAFVVTEDATLTAADLAAQLRGTLSSFAVPTRWHLQTEPLPTNHAGKIDKAALPPLVTEASSEQEQEQAR